MEWSSACDSPAFPVTPLARPSLRSTAAILNNLLLLAGAGGAAVAPNLPALLAARGAAGLGCGAASVLVPRYVAEIAPVGIRGALGTLNQVRATERGTLMVAWCGG